MTEHRTTAAVDDPVMRAEGQFEDLRDRPRNNPLHFPIRRHVENVQNKWKKTNQCPQKYTYDANHLGAYIKSMPSTDRLWNDFRETNKRADQQVVVMEIATEVIENALARKYFSDKRISTHHKITRM